MRLELRHERDKTNADLRYEVDKVQSSVRLDLNLFQGRMRDEFSKQNDRVTQGDVKLDREASGTSRPRLPAARNQPDWAPPRQHNPSNNAVHSLPFASSPPGCPRRQVNNIKTVLAKEKGELLKYSLATMAAFAGVGLGALRLIM